MAFVYWIHLPEHTDMFTQGYVGFTSKTVDQRWKSHQKDCTKHAHTIFYKALKKHKNNLIVTTVVEGSPEYCLEVEGKLRPDHKIGWNTIKGGEKGSLGFKTSDETKAKMSKAMSGTVQDPKWVKLRISKGAMTKEKKKAEGIEYRHSAEIKLKISLASKGHAVSEEHRKAISAAHKGKKKDPVVVAKRALARKEKMQGKPWLGTKAMLTMWEKAQLVSEMILSRVKTCYILDFIGTKRHSQLKTIRKMVLAGWVPNMDASYLEWLDSYKKGQDEIASVN